MTPRGSGNTPLHSFRCPDPLWEAAKARAAERDEPGGLSGVLVRMLEGYVDQAALTPEQVALRADLSAAAAKVFRLRNAPRPQGAAVEEAAEAALEADLSEAAAKVVKMRHRSQEEES